MFELLAFLGSSFISALAQEHQRGAPGAPGAPTRRRQSGGPVNADPQIQRALDEFPLFAANQIAELREAESPEMNNWQWVASRLPYLTEAVALWYVLEDPSVPNEPKLFIAASLIYLVSPVDLIPDEVFPIAGFTDDAAAIAAAIYNTYGYITPEHIEQAKAWLRSQGVEPKPLFALRKTFMTAPAAPQISEQD